MMKPFKKSRKWIIIFIICAVLIFAALLITRFILGGDSPYHNLPGLIVLSISSALIISISGYFGRRLFFWIYCVSVVIALLYAFIVVISDVAPGWGDLTSIIGYLFILIVGIAVAFIAELVRMLLDKSKQPS